MLIELFMWGYQPHFRRQMESRARGVLQVVAPTVAPRALLIGVRTPDKAGGHQVCLEPEYEDWDRRTFSGCFQRAEEIYAEHPLHALYFGDAPSMRDKPENIRKASVLEAVREVTSAYDLEHGTSTHCGSPTLVEGYYIVPILQFNQAELAEYPRLDSPVCFENFKSTSGLLESIIERLLQEATSALDQKEPGRFFTTFPLDATQLLRDAGGRFCSAIILSTRDVMFGGVFDDLNIISSLPYEAAEASGGILFTPADADEVEMRVRLSEPVPLRKHKLARKMIAMSGQDLICVCNGAQGISGFGVLRESEARMFRVTFVGHYKWEVHCGTALLMRTTFGVPTLPSPRLKEATFRGHAGRIFHVLEEHDETRLWRIVEAAMGQEHGTTLVISDVAEDEAKRLKKQSIGISPIKCTPELVRRLSSIDGALLIDERGSCYAIGVILDGMATDDGDSARGARYNSAVRYVASANSPTLCLVVSEDGYIDILPKLRPQACRSQISRQIDLLKTQTIENYHKTRNWLSEHRFYLSAQECDEINSELARIHRAPPALGEIRIEVPAFEPDPAMNDSYYLPELDPARLR